MFTTRLISGIILVLLSIVIVGQGGILLYAVTALISIIGLFELYRALGMQRRSLAVVGYVTACSYYGLLWFEGQRYVTLMIIACLMAMMALYVLTFPEYKTEEVTGAFFGVCYVPIMLSFLYQTRDMSDGAYLVWLIFLSSWGCDTFAYCTGMLLGRHKLAPVLSLSLIHICRLPCQGPRHPGRAGSMCRRRPWPPYRFRTLTPGPRSLCLKESRSCQSPALSFLPGG